MLHTNCHALHFTLPTDAKIQKNAVAGNFQGRKLSLMNFEVFMKVLALFGNTSELFAHVFFAKILFSTNSLFLPRKFPAVQYNL